MLLIHFSSLLPLFEVVVMLLIGRTPTPYIVTLAAVHSKVVLMLLIHFSLLLPLFEVVLMMLIHFSSLLHLFMEFLCLCLFCGCYAVLSVLSSFFFQISCYTLTVFLMPCNCGYSGLFLVVSWVDRSFATLLLQHPKH